MGFGVQGRGDFWVEASWVPAFMWVVVKLRVPFWGTLNNRCRIFNRDPKRDPNSNNNFSCFLGIMGTD